ncbi:CaiB/BaiF CoA transferase family protein [Yoonia sediminilitoris]|uniref:Crotonobetainyl-CoA:carnitine CoA-transferase CaiB-like acyl-CoA transferase n=1 Tax=Yoonia sediminilitoris TaxID=1286148 RepID=A0A2T6KK13_9RHOB|nr:CaiB/BaiF CoA-transferase family protein [Yoonia sediminilitoris]PUB16249.1 crotonobetainyl-CoA:carnitine CoA-transferase CaiB-like acyl-CoA transferase [Yoonia sediminilitoris]RCW96598.1 crotonobetainyl-CoA:carnitine CoA-transferase CaiB-like acyl-CoA transferase [Yoonia sediminilitoris]
MGPLHGIRILDLSRILAGPTCTQLLGDLGAEVIKIENPNGGDDTRSWGPPFVTGKDGAPTDLSAYFLCANRNKLSVAVDISTPEGQGTVRAIAAQSDIVIENFKPGGLAKYGLDAATLCAADPALIYCSISGYGQTGPNAHKPGYDLMAQGYGGIMSLTGEPDGEPMKVGVGIADVMCGMYASVGILAALRHRDQTGAGQHIDLALVDSQVAWLINEGTSYLATGKAPVRRGNGHPNIAPYQVFETADGHVIVAVGNDGQFKRFCGFLRLEALPADPCFATNSARLENRAALIAALTPAIAALSTAQMIAGLEGCGVPVGPVQTVDQVFGSDQVAARDMAVTINSDAAESGKVDLIGNPLKFSATPVDYRRPPPTLGQDTADVLARLKIKP